MISEGNNMNKKIAHLRDSFFDSDEKKFFEEFLKDPKEKNIHEKLKKEDAEKLAKMAAHFINRVEKGDFNEEEMVEIEKIIAHCLGAIEDVQLERFLELTI